MKKAPSKPASKARKVVDAPIGTLRSAVAEVQAHLDAIVAVLDEAERLHREHIRCEPKSLGTAAEFAGRVRRSIEGSWDRVKPRPF